MKYILEFELPEDEDELWFVHNGNKMWMVLWEFAQYLREITKYANTTKGRSDMAYEIKDKFYEILDAENVDIYAVA